MVFYAVLNEQGVPTIPTSMVDLVTSVYREFNLSQVGIWGDFQYINFELGEELTEEQAEAVENWLWVTIKKKERELQ